MVKSVYVVYDKLSEIWMDPQLAPSDNDERNDKLFMVSAIREMKNTESFLYKNCDDLDLYHVGYYDDKTGDFNPLQTKRLVFHYVSLKGE